MPGFPFSRNTTLRLIAAAALAAGLTACSEPRPVSPFALSPHGMPLLAHRGVAQTFGLEGVTDTTCTAARIHPPVHALLENTLDSMRAALAAGASVIEIDVHPTTDGEFAVFHDWTLECRTDGTGRTRDHTMAELKQLDIGHGYTADGGRSWPFRGRGVGLMPSLGEVLRVFPRQPVLINVKSNDADEGERLVRYLSRWPAERRRLIAVYGGDAPVAVVRKQLAEPLTMSRSSLKWCLVPYALLGWSGWTPPSCERSLVLVPINFAGWLWGWPGRFVARMRQAGSAVFVAGDYAGGPSAGIDSVADLRRLPPGYNGGVWTNEIQRIGEALAARRLNKR